MLQLAQKYAKLLKSFIMPDAYRLHEDGSITFVLASGPKLTMTEKELKAAIDKLEKNAQIESQVAELRGETLPAEEKPKSKRKEIKE